MQKAKGSSVALEGFLNELLSNFKTLTEISREFIFSIAYLCCLWLIFIATSPTSWSREIYTLLAFIDLGFPVPIIHSLETENPAGIVGSLSIVSGTIAWSIIWSRTWSLERGQSLFVSCLQNKYIYTTLVANVGIATVVHWSQRELASGNLGYLLGSLKGILLCWTSVPTVKLQEERGFSQCARIAVQTES